MKVFQTNPVRWFSTINMVIPTSMPITSGFTQLFHWVEGIGVAVAAPHAGSRAIFRKTGMHSS